MPANVNKPGYDRRLAVVKQLILKQGLEPSHISTLAYDEDYPYAYNNYLFKVDLARPASSAQFHGTQPGTSPAPKEGVSVLVVKLSNLNLGDFNQAHRVENDVAAQHLVRQSMANRKMTPLVPNIYAWAPSLATTTDSCNEQSFGWIMSEFRSGVDLDTAFSGLALSDKTQVLDQIAAILAAIQDVHLPKGITHLGRLTFDSHNGRVVSADTTGAASYAASKNAKLGALFQRAARSPVLQGWEPNGVAKRVTNFLAGGPEKVLGDANGRKGIIHGDFTTNNLLFDPAARSITAILDFDWSYVSHPFEEFRTVFDELVFGIGNGQNPVIVEALLTGKFKDVDDDNGSSDSEEILVAKAWLDSLKKNGFIGASDMPGVENIRDLGRFQDLLCPYRLASEHELNQLTSKQKEELRAIAEAELVEWLEEHGF